MRSFPHPRLSVANFRLSLSTAGDNGPSLTQTRTLVVNHTHTHSLDHPVLSTTGYKKLHTSQKNLNWTTGTPVVTGWSSRAIASHHWSSRQTHMKAKTTTNVASVVMLVILSPFLALAILVSIQTAGIKDNEVLLLMLTLLSAVLSGINGFGRRTPQAVPLSTAKTTSDPRLHLSTRSSNNA